MSLETVFMHINQYLVTKGNLQRLLTPIMFVYACVCLWLSNSVCVCFISERSDPPLGRVRHLDQPPE